MWHPTTLPVIFLLSCQALAAQIGNTESQYISETLEIDPKLIESLIRTGDAGGKEVRWLTLGQKALKHDMTVKQADAKRRERDLQRAQLAELADGLRRTKELFANYYEKFSLVSNAVQTVSGFLEIGKRIGSIIEIVSQLGDQLTRMDQFTDQERDYIGRMLLAMDDRTRQVLKAAKFALTGNNTSGEELDELREEHGDFLVLMRSIDRTEQLDLLDLEISSIIADLQRMVVFLTNIQNNRQNDQVSEADILRHLLSGN